jgi:ligand-binding sensor protein
MTNRNFSEEAEWFLNNLQTLQDDFAETIGAQIVTTDKEGNLITRMSGAQRVCQIIMATEEGKKKCGEAYKYALSLVRTHKTPVFMDCYAGFSSLWVPIVVKGEIVGSITGCGGRYDRGESREELIEKYSKLADELGIKDKEDFLKAAIDEIKPVTEEEMKKRAQRLAKLVAILAEETALGEIFGIRG